MLVPLQTQGRNNQHCIIMQPRGQFHKDILDWSAVTQFLL